MKFLVLLLSLLSPFISVPPQEETVPAALSAADQPVMLALGHGFSAETYISRFDSLAGVSLYMTEEALLLAKGEPLQIAPDPWGGCLEYQYADITAGICDGIILYVHASPAQAEQFGLMLNGLQLNPLAGNLQELLGAPDFRAEDGDVYIRGSAALKVYRNAGTGGFDGIDLFDGNSF
ncbi:hypothetical protein [Paenibacillus sp. MMS20-IR301]|uniref:hypothetical protein n=1 Tax=Paenibacillus sp. MMS20-IR301 TaxID=2895946 RepID=UPI0028E219E9|nr:hypothetical protein [Paenibacillus sp. MMS20-IR301]WNS42977.1 hypothetical protein LOS79_29085 [Paenibacillus sp. MMS20-IR301]